MTTHAAPPPSTRVRRLLNAGTHTLRRHGLRTVLGLVSVALLWTALVGWWLPSFLRPRIEAGASEALGTPVTLAQLQIQPWTLRVTATGLRIASPGASPTDAPKTPETPPLATLARAEAQLSLQSLWRLAPVLRSLTLDQPAVWLERTGPQRFNLSPVLDRLAARPAAPDAEPARFALYNIRVEGGSLRYDDRVLAQSHRIEALRLGVPFLSNLPSDLAVEVQPLLEARLDGSLFTLTGESKPFAPGRPTELALQWQQVPLAEWATAARPLLPPQARVEVTHGTLDAALTLRFEAPAGGVARLAVQGRVALNGVQARWPAGGWAGRWESLVLEGIDVAPLARQAQLGAVRLAGLQVAQSTPQAVAAPSPPSPSPSSSPPPAAPASAPAAAAAAPGAWQWAVGELQLAASAVTLHPPGGRALPLLGPVVLAAKGLTSAPKAPPAQVSLTAADATGTRLQAQGTLQPAAPSATLALTLDQAGLAPWLQALDLPLPLQVQGGRLAARMTLHADAQAIAVRDAELRLQGFQATPTGNNAVAAANKAVAAAGKAVTAAAKPLDRVALPAVTAQGLQLQWRLPGPSLNASPDAGLTELRLASLTVDRADLAASRDAQQRWRWLPAADTPAAPASSPPAPPTPPTPSTAAPAARFQIDAVRCQACQIALQDEGVSPAARFALTQLGFTVQGVSQDLSRPLTIDLSTQAQGAGQLRFKGSVRPQPLSLDAQLGITNLDLRALQPYLASQLNLTLAAAQAQADGRLRITQAPGQPLAASYQGRAGLTELRTQDSLTGNDFVRWRSLAFTGLDVAWQRNALQADLGRVALDNFYGRVIVHPDGHLNLADVRKQAKGDASQSVTTPRTQADAPGSVGSAGSAPTPAGSGPAPQLRWQQIALGNGRIDFTDNFVKPNYSARLNKLEGEISALAGAGSPPAQVRIGGALDDGAPLAITGRLQPFGERLFADIEGSAKGIELPRLTPYAERYAGYAIEKGTLSVNVHYTLDQGRLQATNHVFLDQLTFGDKVDSPTATKLPVLLAVSLLKNSRGEIDINLPVAGSLDDPQFSIGGIIVRLLGNLLTRAVTSPFSLLAGTFGGGGGGSGGEGGQALGYVPFDPGSAQLDDAARSRLDELAKRLADRPALTLEATGRADPAVDVPGLRDRYLQRLLRQAKAQATGVAPGAARDLAIEPAERERWLEAAYQAAEIKKPRNLIGLAKRLPPAEMEALLKSDADTSPQALLSLADRRADQVNAYLQGKLAADRVQTTRSVVGTSTSTSTSTNTTTGTGSGATAPAEVQPPGSRVQFELR